MAQVEDVALAAVGPPQDIVGLGAPDFRGTEERRRIQVPLDAPLESEPAGRFVDRDAPVHADHVAARGVGIAQRALELALRYSQERKTFGKPIAQHQAIQFKLADMAMETEVARTIVYRAAGAYGQEGGETSDEVRRLAAMCKLYASEASKRAADQAVQIHGGYGFMEDYPVARYWRDVKVNEIGEGTSEVQRMLIARSLGLPVE